MSLCAKWLRELKISDPYNFRTLQWPDDAMSYWADFGNIVYTGNQTYMYQLPNCFITVEEYDPPIPFGPNLAHFMHISVIDKEAIKFLFPLEY